MDIQTSTGIGNLTVVTSNDGGHTPAQWANMARRRIIFVGNKSHRVLRQQALEFGDRIEMIILHFIKKAVEADRRRVEIALRKAGQNEAANIVKEL